MPRNPSQLEIVVLLTLARLEGQGYGVTIRDEILIATGRDFSIAAVYAALDRLERDGLIVPWLSDPRPERGGRARRHFQLTEAGREALKQEHEIFSRLWSGIPAEIKGGSQ